MSTPSHGPDDANKQGQMPRNKARLLIVLTLLLILIVIFGYMLLVSRVGR